MDCWHVRSQLARLAAVAAIATHGGDGDDDDERRIPETHWMKGEGFGLVHYASFLRRRGLIWIILIVIICPIK